jgi:phage/plasmid-associated DNA primase
LPPDPGVHDSYWDRWTALGFHRSFRGESAEVYNLSQLICESERAEVVARALGTIGGLAIRGWCLTLPTSTKELMKRWRREGDSVATFVEECTEEIVDADSARQWTKSSELFRRYRDFCADSEFKPVSSTNFGKRIKSLGIDHITSDGMRYARRLRAAGRSM